MELSDEGKLDIPAVLACQMHPAVVPRQDGGRMERRHPAKRRLAEADFHLVVQRHQKALGEGGTSQLCRALELVILNLCQKRVPGGSLLEGAVTPLRKR